VQAMRKCAGLMMVAWILTSAAVRSADAQDQIPCASPTGIIESVQGTVEIRRQDDRMPRPAALGDAVCPGDAIWVGEYGRAALVLVETSEVIRLDQNTAIRLPVAAGQERPLLDLIMGVVQFFSNHPRSLDVRTPFLNAGVEGTEFVVRVTSDETFLLVFSGRVRAENQFGTVVVSGNRAVTARPGAAPMPQIPVRPRDAVRWAIHYPPVLADLAANSGRHAASDLPDAVRAAIELYHQNRIAEAIARLEATPGSRANPRVLVYRAGLLLQVGRLDEANADLARVLATDPDWSDALALRAVTAVALNDRERALADANRAVALDPRSDAARIAQSYALQASFRLEEARVAVSEALERHPNNALAWARLAELWLSLGYRQRALEAARRAAEIAPDLARTQLVLGFAHLAAMDSAAAEAVFQQAIEFDTADPLPRLGRGLALIRRGDLAGGRRELEIAAGLDSGDSLMRSYLGKAYFEERRDQPAGEQLAIAKELDNKDPTPWFYDAIRKQTENRPVEALKDLDRAIALNDNRAIYRSSLLLDEDLAARSARLGTIYRDLGFEQLALVEGWRSVNLDPGNSSAHRLLADTYLALPRHEIARDSELLQSQLLQPINIQPVQPRLAKNEFELLNEAGPAVAGLNEYTPLFGANRVSLLAGGVTGSHNTFADDLIVSGIYNNYSLSLGQSHYTTDGIRQNNDETQEAYDIFGQVRITPDTSVLAEFRSFEEEVGDRGLRFDPNNFFRRLRSNSNGKTFRLGGRHSFAPNSTLIGSYTFSDQKFDVNLPGSFHNVRNDEVHFLELRHILQGQRLNMTGGIGYLNGHTDSTEFVQRVSSDAMLKHNNAYFYSQLNVPKNMIFTLGVSIEDFSNQLIDRKQVNPKAGLIWNLTPDTVLRAAVFRTLKRTLVSSQTVEPTQVAGFNQFFDDINGTDAWRFGIGLDQKVSRNLFAGGEISRREITVPILNTQTRQTKEFNGDDTFAQAYLYWTPSDWFAVSAAYRHERLVRDLPISGEAAADVTTHRVPIQLGFFFPSGLFSRARATFVSQSGDFENVLSHRVTPGSDRFWVADAAIGYRFPERRGLVALEVKNLFDEQFNFQDVDPSDPSIIQGRTILGRLILRF
jgi:tetratricopeptide (TPR) repeat protein